MPNYTFTKTKQKWRLLKNAEKAKKSGVKSKKQAANVDLYTLLKYKL